MEYDEAKETMESKITFILIVFIVLQEMSNLLNCGIDQRTLTLLVALIENGVNPESLANVVKELQRETRALRIEQDEIVKQQ